MKYALILLLLSDSASAQTFKDGEGVKMQRMDEIVPFQNCNHPQVSFIVHNDSSGAHLIVYTYDMLTGWQPAVVGAHIHYNAEISVYKVTDKGAIVVGVPFMGLFTHGGCAVDANPADHVRKAYSFTVRKETHK